MRQILKAIVLTGAIAGVLAPTPAMAEGYVSPWAGINWGSGNNVGAGRTALGVNAGAMGAGILGAEVSFGYSPSFFGSDNDFGHNTLIDLMGNLIVGVPIGGTRGKGVRPFVTAGVGLVRTQIDGDTFTQVTSTNNMLGWSAGAGVMGYFNQHIGLRTEVRYLRTLVDSNRGSGTDLDPGRLRYWRATAGVTFR